jgi:hypothetical protein
VSDFWTKKQNPFLVKMAPFCSYLATTSKNRFSVTRRDFNVLGKPLVGIVQLEVFGIEGAA